MAKKEKPLDPVMDITDAQARKKALDNALKNIEKTYGKGAVMRLGDSGARDVDVISTSSLRIDMALGIGGPESSGKTTLAMHIIAEAQKKGGNAAFIDAEHALDPIYAASLGVDIDNLIVSQPDTGEQALEILEALLRSGAIDVAVIDSVAALVPRAEIEGTMGDSHVGLHARLMSQALRKLTGVIKNSNTATIFINQLREKVGVMYGNPEVTTGGRALKFYSSVRMDVRRIETLKKDGEMIGNRTRCKVVKNKMAPPFKTAEFDIIYGKGISHEGDVLDMAVELDIIKKSGSWFSYNGERLGQGRDNIRQMLEDNPDLCDEVEGKVRDHYLNNGEETAAPEEVPMDDAQEAFEMGTFKD